MGDWRKLVGSKPASGGWRSVVGSGAPSVEAPTGIQQDILDITSPLNDGSRMGMQVGEQRPSGPDVSIADRLYQGVAGAVNTVPQGVGAVLRVPGILANLNGQDNLSKLAGAVESVQLPNVPGMEDSLENQVGGGLGLVAQAAAAGPVRGLALATGEGSALMGVANYQRTLQATGDQDKAFEAFLGGAGIGALSALPVGRVLDRINKASGGGLTKALADVAIFGGTGGAQAALNDVVLEHATGEDLPIIMDGLKAAGVGAITGALLGAVTHVLYAEPAKNRQPQSESASSQLPIQTVGDSPTDLATLAPKPALADLTGEGQTAPVVEPGSSTAAPPVSGKSPEGAAPIEPGSSQPVERPAASEDAPLSPAATGEGVSDSKKYQYGLKYRPPEFAAPKGWNGVPNSKTEEFPHGVIEFDKPLSRKDIQDFQLEPLDPADPINVKKRFEMNRSKVMDAVVENGNDTLSYKSRSTGRTKILTPDTRNPGKFRITYFTEDGMPSGHEVYKDISDGIDAVARDYGGPSEGFTTAPAAPSQPRPADASLRAKAGLSEPEPPAPPTKEPTQAGPKSNEAGGSSLKVPAEMPKGKQLGTDLTGEPIYSKAERGDLQRAPTPESKESQVGMFDEQGGLFEKQAEARDTGVKANPITADIQPGLKGVASRAESARSRLREHLKERGDLTDEQAGVAFDRYVKDKVVKFDNVTGQFTFAHGDFNERNVMRAAAGITESKPKKPIDPLKVKAVRDELERMAEYETGQFQTGGELIFGETPEGGREVKGRTKWISNAEMAGDDWWSDRPAKLSAEATKIAVRKALDGKPLGPAQQAVVDHMLARITERRVNVEHAAEAEAERAAIQSEDTARNRKVEVAPGVSFLTKRSMWDVFLSPKQAHGDLGPTRPKETLTDPEGRYVPRDETRIEASLRHVADRFHTLRRVEKEAPQPGEFSSAETLMHGRAAYKQKQLATEQDRAIKIMRANKITAQDMGDLANARHASARDAVIFERTGKENGSGMKPERAAEILKKATPEQLELLNIHDRVRERTRRFMVESGLISQATADAWKKTFGDTYTPLKTIEDPATEFVRKGSKSLSVRGPEAKRAEGRESEADNPFVQMFQDAQEVIARGERNIVAQEFGKFAEENPSTAWSEPTAAPVTGEDVFAYKVNGEERYIHVHDKATLKALKNLDPVQANTLLRTAMSGARMMSGLATSRNPEFILPNFARDVQTAVANMSVEQGTAMASRVLKGAAGGVKEMYQAARDPAKATPESREFLEHGAATDWLQPEANAAARLKSLDKRLKESTAREGLREVAGVLEDMSSAVENGVRFSAYKELRKSGVSADKAAVIAKELTVNWSKKGEWGPFANSLYLFFSARANGALRMGQVIRSNPAKAAKVAAAFATFGYLRAMLNANFGGTDEKDGKLWWDKQSDANKQRYAMLQHQDGETTRLPLAPGWGFFDYMGQKLYEMQSHGSTKPDTGNIVSALASEVSPVGGGSLAQVVSPWFLDPFVQVSENKDFKGDPIYHEKYPSEKTPYSSKPDERASETSKAISKLANELSGGNVGREGSVDIPPRAIDYVSGEAASGFGRFMQRVGLFLKAKLKGDSNPWREWPIVSRFKGDAPDTYARDFRANLDRIDVEEAARKAGQPFNADVLRQKTRAAVFEKQVKALRDAGRDEEAKDAMARFNRKFPR